MRSYAELRQRFLGLVEYMDGEISTLEDVSASYQDKIYQLLLEEIERFDTVNGAININTDFKRRILLIESRIRDILGTEDYLKSIDTFTHIYQTIQDRNLSLQLTYNELEVKVKDIIPARQLIYARAVDGFKKNIAQEYIQPVKYLLMQQATSGATIKESKAILNRWNDGLLVDGKFTQPETPTPNLQKYNTQVARDTAYGFHRTLNNIVKDRYGLANIAYVGGVVSDSRPVCKYLVSLRRPISLEEIEQLFTGKIPEEAMVYAPKPTRQSFLAGTVAGTNGDNFCQFCGGYNCRHQALAVR